MDNRKTKLRFDITDKEFYDSIAEMEIPLPSENPIIVNLDTDIETWIAEFTK